MTAGARAGLTTITSLVSRSGHEPYAARIFEETFGSEACATHHLSTLLIQQENGVSFLVSHFADSAALDSWRQSAGHQRMIDAFEAHSLRELCTIDQSVARIIVPSHVSGPKWKIFVTSWAVTFPLLLVLIELYEFVMPQASLLVRLILTSLTMSAVITWFISPIVLRMTRTWRLRDQAMRIEIARPAGVSA